MNFVNSSVRRTKKIGLAFSYADKQLRSKSNVYYGASRSYRYITRLNAQQIQKLFGRVYIRVPSTAREDLTARLGVAITYTPAGKARTQTESHDLGKFKTTAAHMSEKNFRST